eukprot:8002544-Pyramimonas_sp.AAC.1
MELVGCRLGSEVRGSAGEAGSAAGELSTGTVGWMELVGCPVYFPPGEKWREYFYHTTISFGEMSS